jgi:hypothetical protein
MKNFGPELPVCGIALDQTLKSNISANSKKNRKYFTVNLGPW